MRKTCRSVMVAVLLIVAITSAGCVSSGTYQAKEKESIELKKSLEETKGNYSSLEEKNTKLSADNEELTAKLTKLDAEIIALRAENLKMSELLKPENLLKALADSYKALKAENLKLKESLASGNKTVLKLEDEQPVTLSPVVTKPALPKAELVIDSGKDPVDPVKDSKAADKKISDEIVKPKQDAPVPLNEDTIPLDPPAELK